MRCFWHQIAAEIFMFFGDADRALAHLEESASLGLFDVAWLERCPLFEPLRDHPGFASLRAKVGARAGAVLDTLDVQGRARG
jgi:serine/threonine-protein kinase